MKRKLSVPITAIIIAVAACVGFSLPGVVCRLQDSGLLQTTQTFNSVPVAVKQQKSTDIADIFELVSQMDQSEIIVLNKGEYYSENNVKEFASDYNFFILESLGIEDGPYKITDIYPALFLDQDKPEKNSIMWIVEIESERLTVRMVIDDYYGVLVGFECETDKTYITEVTPEYTNAKSMETRLKICYNVSNICAEIWGMEDWNINSESFESGESQTVYAMYNNGYEYFDIPITVYSETDFSVVMP